MRLKSSHVPYRSVTDLSSALKNDSSAQHVSLLEGKPIAKATCPASSPRLKVPCLQVNGQPMQQFETPEQFAVACAEEDDEGQMQCAIRFYPDRSALVVHSLSVQTRLTPGVPGFFTEISLGPDGVVKRSKVYVTAKPDVSLTLRESFRFECPENELSLKNLFIAVKPICGTLMLVAGTDLRELNLGVSQEIFLGGYLKGVYQREAPLA